MSMKRVIAGASVVGLLLAGTTTTASAETSSGGHGRCTPSVLAPGVISSDLEETRVAFTPHGRTAYFGRSETFPPLEGSTILETHRHGWKWQEPEVASFSGEYHDLDPFITPDGRRLLFSSIRPVDGEPRSDSDLWLVERARGGGWGEPRNLGAANSEHEELYPSVGADGDLYFASDRPGGFGGWDLYRAPALPDGTFGPAENLGSRVNTEVWEYNPAPLPGGGLVFTSLDRPGGHGAGDLWATWQSRRGTWTTPRDLGSVVNTGADEFHPSFSPRYDRLYFARKSYDPPTSSDLYSVPTWCLVPVLGHA